MRSIVVKKYKGDRALERGLNSMQQRGYEIQDQSTRKALYSATAGVFTRKQIHTVTFHRQQDAAVLSPAGQREDTVMAPSAEKHWWQEPTVRDVLQGRAERRANREQGASNHV
ncbi:MAG: hypothetical protein ABSB73_09200 [Solirubrobacteraceae bacterium]|jgi:hypothetical protein